MSEDKTYRDDIYSKAVRAGKRTYFFDVRTTRGNDLYVTITESKRRYGDDGKFFYEKHKLFLYKEDFEKFSEGLNEAVDKIKDLQLTGNYSTESPMDREGDEDDEEDHNIPQVQNKKRELENGSAEEFTDVSFEDLED
jgi:hypothetical protein